jgi:hypothetical protein
MYYVKFFVAAPCEPIPSVDLSWYNAYIRLGEESAVAGYLHDHYLTMRVNCGC